jgi:dolichol-phosphate mannosyltransferase
MAVNQRVLGQAVVSTLQSGNASTSQLPLKLSVVIPARNEAENIGPTLDALRERLGREGIDYELVVVDDGSSDATPDEVLARATVDPGVRLVPNTGAHGFGYAVRCGLDAFTGDAVAVAMADGSDSPDDLVRYFYVLRDRAECAFGSRFMPGSEVIDYPRLKLLVNRAANWFIKVLFGLRYNDVTNAFKAYRANVIEGCRPFLSPHFNLTVELPLKAMVRGYSYETLPISWRQRHHGVSSLKLQEMGSRYLFIVLLVWLEKKLTRGDYRRTDGGPAFRPLPRAEESTRHAVRGSPSG